MYYNTDIEWKPNAEYYNHSAAYIRNIRPNNYISFKPRPMTHYRKQYPYLNSGVSKYGGNYFGMYAIPGANIISRNSSYNKCIGVSGIADHKLNNIDRDCYKIFPGKCNKIRRGSIEPVSKNKPREFSNCPNREAALWL